MSAFYECASSRGIGVVQRHSLAPHAQQRVMFVIRQKAAVGQDERRSVASVRI